MQESQEMNGYGLFWLCRWPLDDDDYDDDETIIGRMINEDSFENRSQLMMSRRKCLNLEGKRNNFEKKYCRPNWND